MRKNNKKAVALILILMMLILNLKVFATSSSVSPATVTMQASKNSVAPGDTVVLDLKIGNISLSSGVSTVNLNLDIDDAIFEDVKLQDIEADPIWTKTYNTTTKLLKLTTTQKVKDEKDLAKINLKAKTAFGTGRDITSSGATTKTSTVITLKNIKVNVSRTIDDVSVKLNLGSTQLPESPLPNLNTPTTPGTIGSVAPTKNPDAGLDNPFVIGIITLGIIAGLSVLGHKKASGKIG